MSDARCFYCGTSLDPGRHTWRRTIGWARPGRSGGSDIACREPYGDEYACNDCIRRLQSGLSAGQLGLESEGAAPK